MNFYNFLNGISMRVIILIIDSNNKHNKIQYGTDKAYSQMVSTLGVLSDNIDRNKNVSD